MRKKELQLKGTQIFKIGGKFKIVTLYKSDSGIYKLREPIYIVDQDEELEELKTKIFDSLKSSRSKNFEDDFQKSLLQLLKEKSFRNLYDNSTSCFIMLSSQLFSKKHLIIEPQKCFAGNPQKGLQNVEEDVQKLYFNEMNESKMVEKIVQILNKKY